MDQDKLKQENVILQQENQLLKKEIDLLKQLHRYFTKNECAKNSSGAGPKLFFTFVQILRIR
jgi:hypothetical protein